MKTKILHKGFTLIEVLLVITLIGILLTIGLISFNTEARFIEVRNDTRRNHIQSLESAVNQYKLQEGSYPTGLDRTYQEICDPAATDCTGFFDLKAFLVPKYLQAIPRDPKDTDNTGGSGYEIAIDEASNTVSIRLKESLREGGVDIKVNDPLPDIETSSTNTPLAATVPNSPIVTNGLVLHLDAGNPASYPGTGNTWFDISGNNNNGTLVSDPSTPTYSSDDGGSLVFDGIDDRVSLLTSFLPNQLFADNGGAWTVSCWFRFPITPVGTRVNNTSWSLIGRAGGIATSGHFILFVGSATDNVYGQYSPYKLSATIRGAVTVISPSSVNNNTYNYVTLTWNGSSGAIYFNSQQPINMNVGIAGQQDYSNFFIGSNSGSPQNHSYSGNIGQVSIYNRALTPQEIEQNFNATRGRFGL
jgi:prepilin-type N-terminal cleavage/methylation domain-containing protein